MNAHANYEAVYDCRVPWIKCSGEEYYGKRMDEMYETKEFIDNSKPTNMYERRLVDYLRTKGQTVTEYNYVRNYNRRSNKYLI